jgi:hypothetical protein
MVTFTDKVACGGLTGRGDLTNTLYAHQAFKIHFYDEMSKISISIQNISIKREKERTSKKILARQNASGEVDQASATESKSCTEMRQRGYLASSPPSISCRGRQAH